MSRYTMPTQGPSLLSSSFGASIPPVGAAAAPQPHTFQEDYEVLKVLGSGAYGIVHKAKHKITGQIVAAKKVDLHAMSSFVTSMGSTRDLSQEEVRILTSVRHPNIVRLESVYEEGDARGGRGATGFPAAGRGGAPAAPARPRFLWLVMEFVNEGELFDKIINKRRFPEESARALFKQLVSGIAYLHGRGIVHRDLKPENVLMHAIVDTKDGKALGKRYVVKISDFGLSAVLTGEKGAGGIKHSASPGGAPPPAGGRLVSTKTVAGTELYLAPEVSMLQVMTKDRAPKYLRTMIQANAREFPAKVGDGAALSKAGGKRRRSIAATSDVPPFDSAIDEIDPTARCRICPDDDAGVMAVFDTGYDFKVDIWSLGVILFILLYGKMPFYTDGDRAGVPLLEQALRGFVLHSLAADDVKLSDSVKDLIRKMLTVNPAKRLTIEQVKRHPWLARTPSGPAAGAARAGSGTRGVDSITKTVEVEASADSTGSKYMAAAAPPARGSSGDIIMASQRRASSRHGPPAAAGRVAVPFPAAGGGSDEVEGEIDMADLAAYLPAPMDMTEPLDAAATDAKRAGAGAKARGNKAK